MNCIILYIFILYFSAHCYLTWHKCTKLGKFLRNSVVYEVSTLLDIVWIKRKQMCQKSTVLLWVIAQWIMLIPYWCVSVLGISSIFRSWESGFLTPEDVTDTLVRNCHYSCSNPEEHSSHLLCGRSLKSCINICLTTGFLAGFPQNFINALVTNLWHILTLTCMYL
jgi:hypothetical protein